MSKTHNFCLVLTRCCTTLFISLRVIHTDTPVPVTRAFVPDSSRERDARCPHLCCRLLAVCSGTLFRCLDVSRPRMLNSSGHHGEIEDLLPKLAVAVFDFTLIRRECALACAVYLMFSLWSCGF